MLRKKVFHSFSILLGLLGCILMCVGAFIPLITVGGVAKTVISEIGPLIPILAVVSAIACYFSETIIPTASTIMSLYFLANYIRGISQSLAQYMEYSYGFYILAVGIILLAAYSFFGVIDKFTYLINHKKKKSPKVKPGISMGSTLSNISGTPQEVPTNNQSLIRPTVETYKKEEPKRISPTEEQLANNQLLNAIGEVNANQVGVPELDLDKIAMENEIIKGPVQSINQSQSNQIQSFNNNDISQEEKKEVPVIQKDTNSLSAVKQNSQTSNTTEVIQNNNNQNQNNGLNNTIINDPFLTPEADFIVNSNPSMETQSAENNTNVISGIADGQVKINEPEDNIFTQNTSFEKPEPVESSSIISSNINGTIVNTSEPVNTPEPTNKFFGGLMDSQPQTTAENNSVISQPDLLTEMNESKQISPNQNNNQINNQSINNGTKSTGVGDAFNDFFNQPLIENPTNSNNQNMEGQTNQSQNNNQN